MACGRRKEDESEEGTSGYPRNVPSHAGVFLSERKWDAVLSVLGVYDCNKTP